MATKREKPNNKNLVCYVIAGKSPKQDYPYIHTYRLFRGEASVDQLSKAVAVFTTNPPETFPKDLQYTITKIKTPNLNNLKERAARASSKLHKLWDKQRTLRGIQDAFQNSGMTFQNKSKHHPVHTYHFWASGNGGQHYDHYFMLTLKPASNDEQREFGACKYHECCQPEGYRGWESKKIRTPHLRSLPTQLKKLDQEIALAKEQHELVSTMRNIVHIWKAITKGEAHAS
jgi:hypothetical protein